MLILSENQHDFFIAVVAKQILATLTSARFRASKGGFAREVLTVSAAHIVVVHCRVLFCCAANGWFVRLADVQQISANVRCLSMRTFRRKFSE
nr:hypothetical protein [uncultured Ruegeria sp.]